MRLGRASFIGAFSKNTWIRDARKNGSTDGIAILNEEGNLPEICTPKGKELAETLRGVLEELEFDRLNRELQHELFGADYAWAPYPIISESEVDYSTIRERLELYVQGLGPMMTARQKAGFLFFAFSKSLRRKELEVLFGEEGRHRINDFLDAGLFVETSDGRIRMNGLFLLSKRLGREGNGAVIYVLADSKYCDDPEQKRSERVYIGLDSYALLNRLPNQGPFSGTGIDMGSGSGIQLIAALKLFPDIERMVGYEIDRRAVNVSKFNACLNGVDDRATIVENEKDLLIALEPNGKQVDFAVSNPPYMPVPEFIEVNPDDAQTLSKAKALSIVGNESAPRISLKRIWPASGWGGADGMSVLRPMLETLFPLIKPSGKIVIFAEFAGKARGPTKIVEFIEAQRGWEHRWQPLKAPPYISGGAWHPVLPFLPAQFMARSVMAQIIGGYPELAQPLYRDILMKYAEKILDAYQRLDITHFHKGFVHLTRQS